ncbi:MAG: hypothetical protein E3J67_00105 [Dehalococcoidia bacterium]|nr:MAG: hypothetical protein E3J67_00105 [Dehalococcoidia bacterium]
MGKIRLIIATSLVLIISLGAGCTPEHSFDSRLSSIVKPYRFSIIDWEMKVLLTGDGPSVTQEGEDELSQVREYFSLVERVDALKSEIEVLNTDGRQGDLASLKAELELLEEQQAAVAGVVGGIIKKQIEDTLAEQGILNPVDEYIKLETHFPPLNFKLEQPPYLLVISPRNRIDSIREIPLRQDISLEEIEAIEAEVDRLGVSSLVVELGGFAGTYPTFVANDASLQFVICTATEEWLHQYLVFKPLGFLYLLDVTGISRDYDIATINEAVAGMVSKEIGAIVYQKYFTQHENGNNQIEEAGFDFNQEMREIRRTVDGYLAQGEIELAEGFMEQKRWYLASRGYYIRKLNQAYFAFHGTYADRPTSISPIGSELETLRGQSDSLKDFLDTVAAMTSRQDLIGSIG